MTVAAVIVAASAEDALADAAGRVAVRRIVESAWAGGAVPIVVVTADPDGRVAEALAGSGAVLAEPAPSAGPAGQLARGLHVARETVAETDAVLAWPVDLPWVDAETVTSLIQGHGVDPDAALRPTWQGEPGLPMLIPVIDEPIVAMATPQRLAELATGLEAAGRRVRTVDLGDPGTTHDRSTPLDALPPYEGPPEPIGGHPPEWGAAAADHHDEAPLEGPALAPYEPA